MNLLEPSEIILTDGTDKPHKFTLSKFPAWQGAKIRDMYELISIPKLMEYNEVEKIRAELLSFVAVNIGSDEIPIMQPLDSQILINNHIADHVLLKKIEDAMKEKNFLFFQKGMVWNFFEQLIEEAVPKVLEILTNSLEQLSQVAKQPSMNSEQSTL